MTPSGSIGPEDGVSHRAMQSRQRAFVVTPYRAKQDGTLAPDIPTHGVCVGQDGRQCRLNFDHRRQRSTGPCFPLTVMRCRPHKRCFTLYPPGHMPYGRRAVVPVAPDGSPVQAPSGVASFCMTLFEAALDAAKGIPWHREGAGPTGRWWGKQLRWLKLVAQLLALAPGTEPRLRERIADILGIDLLLLREQARAFRSGGGYRARGHAVRCVLEALPRADSLPERLLACGHLAGHWGAVYRWLPQIGSLQRQAGTVRPRSPP